MEKSIAIKLLSDTLEPQVVHQWGSNREVVLSEYFYRPHPPTPSPWGEGEPGKPSPWGEGEPGKPSPWGEGEPGKPSPWGEGWVRVEVED